VKTKIPDSIDSALLAALRDSRERLGLLKLEQVLTDYCRDSDPIREEWQVGGPYNSIVRSSSSGAVLFGNPTTDPRPQTTFQRCLLHRLADRFQIAREPQEDGFIRLIKLPDTRIPSQLLLNLDPSDYAPDDTITYNSNSNNNVQELMPLEQLTIGQQQQQQPNQQLPPQSTKSSKPRKMKIMKRASSNVSSNASSSDSKSSRNKNRSANSLSDKEKAYAEARARIFAADATTSEASATTPTTTNEDAPEMARNPSPAHNQNYIQATPPPPQSVLNEPIYEEAAGNSSNNNNRPSKATWRNRQSEMNDPDFQRGRSVPQYYTPPPPQAQAASTTTAATNTIGYGYGQPPQHQHHQQLPQTDPYQQPQPTLAQQQQFQQQQQQQYGYYPSNNNINSAVGAAAAGRGGPRMYNAASPNINTNPYRTSSDPNTAYGATAIGTPSVHSLEDFPSLR
jgi:hypothetical protein